MEQNNPTLMACSVARIMLTTLISKYVPPQPLCSDDQISPQFTKMFGKRAFAKVTPNLWNPLPFSVKEAPSIDSFKTSLKAYLFNKSFW